MLTTERIDDRTIGFSLEGEVDQRGMDELLGRLEGTPGKVRLLGEIRDIDGWENVQSLFSNIRAKFAALGKIERYAVLADKHWIETLARVADFVTPHFPLRHFGLYERDKAIAWLHSEAPERGLQITELEAKHVLGFTIAAPLTDADYEVINAVFDAQIAKFGEIRLLIMLVEFDGFSNISTLLEDLRTSINYYSRIKKVAIMGRKDWLATATKIGDVLTPGMKLRHFPIGQREAAVDWLAVD
jgi:hypothetical protein